MNCPLCKERIPKGGDPDYWKQAHMAFTHALQQCYRSNTSEGVADSYYYVLDEPREINGRRFTFGDYIEFDKSGKVRVHAPGNSNQQTIKIERHFEGIFGSIPGEPEGVGIDTIHWGDWDELLGRLSAVCGRDDPSKDGYAFNRSLANCPFCTGVFEI